VDAVNAGSENMVSNTRIETSEIIEQKLQSFSQRLAQAIARSGLNQTQFANKLGISPSFVSDVLRGNKKPGAEVLCKIRVEFGVSADWLLTGEGQMSGETMVDMELLQTVRLYVGLARASVVEKNQTAKRVSNLIRDGRAQEVLQDAEVAAFVETIPMFDQDDALALELYNMHLETTDPIAQQRNLFAAAMFRFQAQQPFDNVEALSRVFQKNAIGEEKSTPTAEQ
jgi:transcriptional regulator with XRE-family HTH domain